MEHFISSLLNFMIVLLPQVVSGAAFIFLESTFSNASAYHKEPGAFLGPGNPGKMMLEMGT